METKELGQQYISNTPEIGILAFPFKNRFVGITEQNVLDVIRLDITSSVKQVVYQKSKSSPSGTFSINLTSDQNWSQILRPGDWILIYESTEGIGIIKEGEDNSKGLRCLGNIDRVSRQKIITNDGKKIFTFRIDGRDFGKIFEKQEFYYNPYIHEKIQQNLTMWKGGVKIVGSPADFVLSYLDLYLGDGYIKDIGKPPDHNDVKVDELDQLNIPLPILQIFGKDITRGKFMDILRVDIPGVSPITWATPQDHPLYPVGFSWAVPPEKTVTGNLWSILTSVANLTMNELYTSMKYYPAEDRVYPTLTLRKIPFTNGIFVTLPKITIQENMIINDDMGFNDHERINWMNLDAKHPFITDYFQFMAASKATTQDKNTKEIIPLFPHIDKLSLKRYGLHQRHFETEFLQISDGYTKQGKSKVDKDIAESWMRELISWWEDYERYESGTMLIKGFSDVNVIYSLDNPQKIVTDLFNIGDNIYLVSRNRLYQLEGYSWEWIAPGEYFVTFIVTRGVYWDGISKKHLFVDEKDGTFDSKNQIFNPDIASSIYKRKK